jgi:acetyl esterase/lipase
MLAHGVEPSRLVVLGDSAGGTLVVSVQVALRDAGDPLPAAGVAISPWANLTHSGESFTTKVGVDPLCTKAALDVQAALFLGGAPADDARVSPVFADVHGLSPTLVQIGEAEVMLSDAVRLADRLATAAVQTRLDVWPGMFHVWHLFAETMPEAARAIDDIAAFIDRHTGG